MARTFNVTGSCDPQLHYMVDLTERLKKIKALIDRGDYFTINRARQYGKTTTIKALRNYLREDYIVISLDFQRIGNAKFATEHTFTQAFANYLTIINGTGHSYVEARTRSLGRTDIVVDYLGEQFVIELKIWRGPKYHAEGEAQIAEYLDYYGLKKGYMITFNFNKTKETGVKEIQYGEYTLIEAVV